MESTSVQSWQIGVADAERAQARLAQRVTVTLALFVFPSVLVSVAVPRVVPDQAAAAAVYTALALGGAAGSLAGGILMRRVAPVPLLRASAALAAVLFGALAGIPLRGAGLLLVCASFAVLTAAGVVALALLPRLQPASPRRTLALSLAVSAMAGALFPMLAQALLAWTESRALPPAAAMSMGLLVSAAALFGASLWLGGPSAQLSSLQALETDSAPLTRAEWRITAVAGVLGAVHAAADNTQSRWSMFHFTENFHAPAFPPAAIMSGCAVAYCVTRLMLARAPERRGGTWLLVAPGFAGAALMWLSLGQTSFTAAAVAYVLAAACYGLEYPVLLGAIARVSPRSIAPAAAAANLGAYVLGALANPLLGALSVHFGTSRAAMAVLPLGFVSFSVIAWITRTATNPQPANPAEPVGATQ